MAWFISRKPKACSNFSTIFLHCSSGQSRNIHYWRHYWGQSVLEKSDAVRYLLIALVMKKQVDLHSLALTYVGHTLRCVRPGRNMVLLCFTYCRGGRRWAIAIAQSVLSCQAESRNEAGRGMSTWDADLLFFLEVTWSRNDLDVTSSDALIQ